MSNLIEAVKMQHPETIPVSVNILPAAWLKYGSELQRLTDQYPQFFASFGEAKTSPSHGSVIIGVFFGDR